MAKTKIITIGVISLCLLTLIVGVFFSLEIQKQISATNASIKQLNESVKSIESKVATTNLKDSTAVDIDQFNEVKELDKPVSDTPVAAQNMVPADDSTPQTQVENRATNNQQTNVSNTPPTDQKPVIADMWESNGEVFTVWSVYPQNANLFLGDFSSEQISNCTNIRPIGAKCSISYQLLSKYLNNISLDKNSKVRVWGKYRWLDNDARNITYEFTEISKIEKV